MTANAPTTQADLASDFTPAQPRPRSDGWTVDRQRAFIAGLAEWGSVRAACDHVGMSPTSAYLLRAHPTGEQFRIAWNLALDAAHARLVDLAMDRARDGTPKTVFHKGQPIGEQRVYSDRLLMFMLRRHDQSRGGRAAESRTDVDKRTVNDSLAMALMRLNSPGYQSPNGARE